MTITDPTFNISLPNLDAHDGVADLYTIPMASYDWVFKSDYYKCPITSRMIYQR
jgi:hypothetical protein